MKRESGEDNSDNDNDTSRRRWRSLMGNIYCTQEAETSFNPRWCRVFLGSYLQLKLVWNDNTDLCSARPFWPIWLHSCQLTVWPLPGGNWSLPGTNGRRTGMLQALVCLEDNDKRPVWPCLDGSSFPPSERGHCARLPLGSGVCQHVGRSSAEAPEEASQAQPGVAAAIGERMMIKSFPWSFAQGCYFKVAAYTGPVQTIVKVKWGIGCFFGSLIIELIDAWKSMPCSAKWDNTCSVQVLAMLNYNHRDKNKNVWPASRVEVEQIAFFSRWVLFHITACFLTVIVLREYPFGWKRKHCNFHSKLGTW